MPVTPQPAPNSQTLLLFHDPLGKVDLTIKYPARTTLRKQTPMDDCASKDQKIIPAFSPSQQKRTWHPRHSSGSAPSAAGTRLGNFLRLHPEYLSLFAPQIVYMALENYASMKALEVRPS
jgi:hypothetical protein